MLNQYHLVMVELLLFHFCASVRLALLPNVSSGTGREHLITRKGTPTLACLVVWYIYPLEPGIQDN